MRSPVNRFAPLLLGAAFLTGAPALRAAGKKPPHRPGQAPASAPAKTAPTVRLPPPAEKPPEKHEAPPLPAEKVLFLTELPNPNDYTLFANGGGWDGNWYVGYNTCWISELPAIPQTGFTRAFLGARLGRMKTEAAPRLAALGEKTNSRRDPNCGQQRAAMAAKSSLPPGRNRSHSS